MSEHGFTREDAGGYYCSRCGLDPDEPDCPGPPPAPLNTMECDLVADLLVNPNSYNKSVKGGLIRKLRAYASYRGNRWRVGR